MQQRSRQKHLETPVLWLWNTRFSHWSTPRSERRILKGCHGMIGIEEKQGANPSFVLRSALKSDPCPRFAFYPSSDTHVEYIYFTWNVVSSTFTGFLDFNTSQRDFWFCFFSFSFLNLASKCKWVQAMEERWIRRHISETTYNPRVGRGG